MIIRKHENSEETSMKTFRSFMKSKKRKTQNWLAYLSTEEDELCEKKSMSIKLGWDDCEQQWNIEHVIANFQLTLFSLHLVVVARQLSFLQSER